MEVLTASAMPLAFPPNGINGQHFVDEFAELEKIVRLRDAIYSDKHPRFKPLCHKVQNLTPASPQPVLVENARPAPPSSPRAQRPTPTPAKHAVGRGQNIDTQISGVLLTKSDVLIKAEINLKRDRIERELKQLLENKAIEDRMRFEGRGRESNDELDVESILAKAQALVADTSAAPLSRAAGFPRRKNRSFDDTNSELSIEQSQYDENQSRILEKDSDTGEQNSGGPDVMDIDQINSKPVGAKSKDGIQVSQIKEKVLNIRSGRTGSSQTTLDNRKAGSPQQATNRAIAFTDPSRYLPPSLDGPEAPILVRSASIRERPPPGSPLQPQRHSVARTDEPVAPQPVRPVPAVDRLAAQDMMVIDLREEESEQGFREISHIESRRSPVVKAEPRSPPSSVAGTIRRSASPDRRTTRMEAHQLRRSYLENPDIYHYPHPISSAHVHPAYDPYYRPHYTYPPPPPLEFTRPYARVYSPGGYPIYDEYSRIYHPPPHVVPILPPHVSHSLPQPLPPVRQPSRALERRPLSPEIPYRRRGSRSLSPQRVLEDSVAIRAPVERAVSRAPSLAPSTHREFCERHVLPPPPLPGHYDPYVEGYSPRYYAPYLPSERTVYYGEREYYARRPPIHYLAELPLPPSPREIRDGSVAPRGVVIAGYRDRDYIYPPLPPPVMGPPPRPYPPVEYREYRREVLPREIEEGRARSMRPEGLRGREEEYVRAVSLRPERNGAYAPPPSQTAAIYRSLSVRPETSRAVYRIDERGHPRTGNETVGRDFRDREYAPSREHRGGDIELETQPTERRYSVARGEERGRDPVLGYLDERR